MPLTDDLLKLETDAMAFVPMVEGIVPQARIVVSDLEALGVDVQGYFAAHAVGDTEKAKVCCGTALEAQPGGPKLDALMKLLLTYGPVIYGMLAAMFKWPPLPFPVPTPTP